MELFCAKCGTELTKEEYFHGLCQSCFEQEHPLFEMKESSLIKICSQCLSSLSKGQWVDLSTHTGKEAITKAVIENSSSFIKPTGKIEYLKVIPHPNEAKSEKKNHLSVPVTIVAKGKADPSVAAYTAQRSAQVHVYFTICNRCKSLRQSRFVAILQVRAKGRKVTERERKAILSILDNVMERIPKDRTAFCEIKEQRRGFNMRFGSLSTARKVLLGVKNTFGGISRESRRLMGTDKSGKRTFRTVISLRLPSFGVSDILIVEGLPNQVLSIIGDKVVCINLGNLKHISYPLTDVWNAEILNKEEIKVFLVLTILPDIVQLMDMQSFQTFETSRPSWDIRISEETRGIVANNRIFLLPPENYLKDISSKGN
ncbi:MAG: NMD3-related protein [Promethearchaeota archaeon]